MYITIEGIDTAGKSTQINALKYIYPNAVFTKEPGGTDIGKELRELVLFKEIQNPLTELFIFLADRAEHIKRTIKPNLNNLIISDRSVISGIAYAGKTTDLQKLIELNSFACDNIFPKKAIILKLSQKELNLRLATKHHDKIEMRGTKYLLDIQEALLHASELLKIQTLCIDASLHVDDITKQITKFIGE